MADDRERILVGVDGSDGALGALRWAIDEARRRDAIVVALHAWGQPTMVNPLGVPTLIGDRPEYERAARTLLDAAVAEALGPSGRVDVEKVTVEAQPAEALLAHAADVDLVVVGSRGRGGFAGLLLGSVSQRCAQHSQTPVVIVPDRHGSDRRRR